MNIFAEQPVLPTIWFVLIAILWIGYLILDGFDLGVGMMMSKVFAHNEQERRLLLNTIGPVWDGNEVWLVTAGAATFAAFPFWYASLFSALYLPLTLALVFLILRVVAIDYRGKKTGSRWIGLWNTVISLASFFIAFLVGALLGITTTGLPLDSSGNVVGAFTWVTQPFTYIGGLGFVFFSYVQGLAFVGLKTDGAIRYRARSALLKLLPVAVTPLAGWALWLQLIGNGSGIFSWSALVLSVLAVVLAIAATQHGREGWAFVGTSLFATLGATAIFLALFPNVLPSTLSSANNLTIENASSSDYTLGLMSWFGIIMLPVIMIYQGWSYYQFRQRMRVEHIPEAHDISNLVRQSKAGSS